MDQTHLGAVERVARVLAARHASANAEGDEQSASAEVDARWPDHRDTAIAILKTLREPDGAMAAAGSAAMWSGMIDAALGTTRMPAPAHREIAEPGTDPLHEGP